LNLGGVRYAWASLPILALFATALAMGIFFVLRLLSAPEPLIPVAVLKHPVVRCAISANACGWGAIMGLNVFLPMYLQGVVGLSATQAGLSLMALMLSLNTCAGLAGQVLGRVRHYKRLPMIALTLGIAAILTLAWQAAEMTPFWFEVTLIVIGVGFGPLPSLTAVALQNVVARHQLGISVGAMNFSRNLFATMLIAVFGAIVLTGTTAGQSLTAAFHAVALIAIIVMEEKPLQTGEREGE